MTDDQMAHAPAESNVDASSGQDAGGATPDRPEATEGRIRLAAIRDICKREGHNLYETTTIGQLPLQEYICGRGCGAVTRKIRTGYSITAEHAITVLSARAGRTPVTELTFTIEPKDED